MYEKVCAICAYIESTHLDTVDWGV